MRQNKESFQSKLKGYVKVNYKLIFKSQSLQLIASFKMILPFLGGRKKIQKILILLLQAIGTIQKESKSSIVMAEEVIAFF